jgi:hypothetical protein
MLVALDFQRKGNYLEKGGCKAALFSFGRQIRSLRAPVRPIQLFPERSALLVFDPVGSPITPA